jgi:hypothetical protein
MCKTALVARLGLCATLAIASLPAAAGFLFPFTANNMAYNDPLIVVGVTVPTAIAGTADIAGTLVADQTGPTTYTITGLQDFSVTATSGTLQGGFDRSVTLDAGGVPSAPSTITWDGVNPTGWSLDSVTLFIGGVVSEYSETLSLAPAFTLFHSLDGTLPSDTLASEIEVGGTWVPGAATQQVPVPPTLPLVAAGLGLVGRLRRRCSRPSVLQPVIQYP